MNTILLYTFISNISDKDKVNMEKLLPTARRERYQASKRNAVEPLVAYALLRHGLREYAGIEKMPEIAYNEKGKPEFIDSSIYFSLSHTNGCAACAISRAPVGCDVEGLRPVKQNLAKRVLPEDMFTLYTSSDNPEKVFFEYWTKLESALKKRGDGLTGGLKIDSSEKCATFEKDGYILSVSSDVLPDNPVLVDKKILRRFL